MICAFFIPNTVSFEMFWCAHKKYCRFNCRYNIVGLRKVVIEERLVEMNPNHFSGLCSCSKCVNFHLLCTSLFRSRNGTYSSNLHFQNEEIRRKSLVEEEIPPTEEEDKIILRKVGEVVWVVDTDDKGVMYQVLLIEKK